MKFKLINLCLLGLFCLVSFSFGDDFEELRKEVEQSLNRPIRLGLTEIPPQVIITEDGVDGLCIDFIEWFEQTTGIKFERVFYGTWMEVLAASQRGDIDVIWAAQRNAEREQWLSFSEPYLTMENHLIVKRDSPHHGLADMSNQQIAVSAGSAIEQFLQKNYPEIKLKTYGSELLALMSILSGETDGAVMEPARATFYITKNHIDGLRIAQPVGLTYQLGMAARKDLAPVLQLIELGVSQFTELEQEQLMERWGRLENKPTEESGFIWREIIYWTIITLMMVGLIVSLQIHFRKNKLMAVKAAELAQMAEIVKGLEEELSMVKLQHGRAIDDKSHFLQNLTNHVRNPMNRVLTLAEVLRNRIKHPVLQQHLMGLYNGTRDLLTFFYDLVRLAQLEGGRFNLQLKRVNVRHLMSESIRTLEPAFKEKGVLLCYEVSQTVPQNCFLDRGCLRQIVNNLCDILMRQSNNGRVEIYVSSVVAAEAETLDLFFAFRENTLALDRLEQMMHEISKATDAQVMGGEWLSLSVVLKILKKLSGTIQFVKHLGMEREVNLCFKGLTWDSVSKPTVPIGNLNEVWSDKKMLLVDDLMANRELVISLVDFTGITIIEAENANDAVSLVCRESPDLILVDTNLPDVSGKVLAETIHSSTRLENIPIIMMEDLLDFSGDTDETNPAIAGTLCKPIKRDELLVMMSTWFNS